MRGANVKSIKTTRHTGAFLVPCVLPEPRQNILTIFQVDKMNGKKTFELIFLKRQKAHSSVLLYEMRSYFIDLEMLMEKEEQLSDFLVKCKHTGHQSIALLMGYNFGFKFKVNG